MLQCWETNSSVIPSLLTVPNLPRARRVRRFRDYHYALGTAYPSNRNRRTVPEEEHRDRGHGRV